MLLKVAKVSIVIIFSLLMGKTTAQIDLNYYLPDIEYNEAIPTPESILSYQVGEWHVTHDQLIHYLKVLCEKSENCQWVEYARSHENRPLVNLVISSKENLANLESHRIAHRDLVDKSKSSDLNLDKIPLVLYQGYSIHGDEASGSNASMLVAYYLLAGESRHLNQLLDQTIILLDPCYNPDGLQRFSTWATMHRNKALVSDPQSREFNAMWPRGRTNHYWFDLNRDWLFNIHPESKGRIERFHLWKPDVLTDHHEMGSNSTFFFQPGIPSRTNTNTPQINQTLTEEIGTYHASYLDSIGSAYFSKESFDDFYYGKGSTYPDVNGCIGILFEQASSRGYKRDSNNGLLTFPFTIRNQFVTSLSTQRAALELKEDILNYKRDYYAGKLNTVRKGAYIFEAEDAFKRSFLLEILLRHKIDVYAYKQGMAKTEHDFKGGNSFIVPMEQAQFGLVKTIFEKVRSFNDSLFYDVSAWTVPLALNIPYEEIDDCPNLNKLNRIHSSHTADLNQKIEDSFVALALSWEDYMSPKLVHDLLARDVKLKVLMKPSSYYSAGAIRNLSAGTIIIPSLKNLRETDPESIEFIEDNANALQIGLIGLDSGQSIEGVSLGSRNLRDMEEKNIALIVGNGANRYEAGSSWYQLDHRWGIPVTLLDLNQFRRANLEKYDVIILPDGRYSSTDLNKDKLSGWVQKGGTLIAMRGALNYLTGQNIIDLEKKAFPELAPRPKDYDDVSATSGAQVIGGSIFQSKIDLKNPLAFGYESETLPVFKRGTQFYEPLENALANVMIYKETAIESGYISDRNAMLANGALGVACFGKGSGQIVAMVDNPNFRGYWLGGSRLFANAIFFSDLIQNAALER
ncbi:MAG: zinc carboxypeptidase [Saprospiraceae bacterium]|nr:zinc carboxypeptidase [Saprospiraceae bacterium]